MLKFFLAVVVGQLHRLAPVGVARDDLAHTPADDALPPRWQRLLGCKHPQPCAAPSARDVTRQTSAIDPSAPYTADGGGAFLAAERHAAATSGTMLEMAAAAMPLPPLARGAPIRERSDCAVRLTTGALCVRQLNWLDRSSVARLRLQMLYLRSLHWAGGVFLSCADPAALGGFLNVVVS